MKPDSADILFRKYYNEALLYTMSLCRNRTVAEDIVSDAFYKALSTADDEILNFKSWLLTVCRNEFINVCRHDKRFTGEEIPEETSDGKEDLAESIIREEQYKALYRAIDLLAPNQKEVITLFYFNRLQIKEISCVTGKSEQNVKVLLCRGREKLKEYMEGSK